MRYEIIKIREKEYKARIHDTPKDEFTYFFLEKPPRSVTLNDFVFWGKTCYEIIEIKENIGGVLILGKQT
jgi:hypothetical protein